jgi:hypothetical protein
VYFEQNKDYLVLFDELSIIKVKSSIVLWAVTHQNPKRVIITLTMINGGGGDDEHDDEHDDGHGNSNKRQKIEDDDEDAVPAVAADRYWEENNTYDILECHSASADSPASILSSEVANALFLTLAEKNGY